MNEPDLISIVIRMDRIEEENARLRLRLRWLIRGFAAVLAAMIGLGLAWPRLVSAPRSVRARQFVLEDDVGRLRAVLGVKPGIPDATPVDRVLEGLGYRMRPVSVSGVFGPTLRFFDEAGKERMALGMNALTDGIPLLGLADSNGIDRFVVYAMGDGSTVLEMRDAASRRRVGMTTTTNGQAILSINDASRRVQFVAPTAPSLDGESGRE